MRFAVSALLVLCACASAPTPDSATTRPETFRTGGTGSLTLVEVVNPIGKEFTAPVDTVWRALAAAFDTLGIRAQVVDARGHVMGNLGQKVVGRLGKTPLSRYIDCGQTQIGPNADSYEVHLTINSTVSAAGTGSKLGTTVEASAKPLQFSQDYSRCTSKGVLELRIAEAVELRLPK